jgi:lipopolysaccharide transport protein LptA
MPRRSLILLTLMAAAVWPGTNAGAAPRLSLPLREDLQRLPIDLEAASSQFDGKAGLLSFQDVHITQGPMSVRAKLGRVARLDFENSLWRFDGDVVLDNAGARIECESAELTFQNHELRTALFRGTPASFRQERPAAAPTEGKAGVIEYDVKASTIRLSGAAWISDGANEVSGERMAYDLARRYVTADSNGSGAVRMKIKPPEERNGQPSP